MLAPPPRAVPGVDDPADSTQGLKNKTGLGLSLGPGPREAFVLDVSPWAGPQAERAAPASWPPGRGSSPEPRPKSHSLALGSGVTTAGLVDLGKPSAGPAIVSEITSAQVQCLHWACACLSIGGGERAASLGNMASVAFGQPPWASTNQLRWDRCAPRAQPSALLFHGCERAGPPTILWAADSASPSQAGAPAGVWPHLWSQCRTLGRGCNWERLSPRQRLPSSTCCLCGQEEQAEEAGLAGVRKVACEMTGAKSLAKGLVTPVCLAFCTMGCGDQVPTYSLGRFLRVTGQQPSKGRNNGWK